MKALLEQLNEYRLKYNEEEEKVDKLIKIIDEKKDLRGKDKQDGHLTGSAWIINRDKSHVLLTHHAKLNMWIQLGGHTDEGEGVYESAYREAVEESMLKSIVPVTKQIFDIDIHLIPNCKGEKQHYHYDIRYLFYADMEEDFVVTEESLGLAWVPLCKIGDYTNEESIIRMVEKTIKNNNKCR